MSFLLNLAERSGFIMISCMKLPNKNTFGIKQCVMLAEAVFRFYPRCIHRDKRVPDIFTKKANRVRVDIRSK